jgi:hypothetical protein
MEIFFHMCDSAYVNPTLIKNNFEDAAKAWWLPVGLLFWDAGQNAVKEAMKWWEPHVMQGGILALHDTYSNMFEAGEYMKGMIDDGKYCQYEIMPGGVHVAVKR